MNQSKISINPSDKFPHLNNPPIVEAAIFWEAVPAEPFDPVKLLELLRAKLPAYPKVSPQHEMSVEHQFGPQGVQFNQRHAWEAFQLSTDDGTYVCQFRKAGLLVSRLPPYLSWPPFRDEAVRLWDVYTELASPPEIQRLGIRYINLVPVKSLAEASELLKQPPRFPGDWELPLAKYVHQYRMDVPGYPIQLNLVQTVQPAAPDSEKELNLIVDFEISSSGPKVSTDDFQSGKLFDQMRWLKNKAFFSVFSDQAIQQFKGQNIDSRT